jgi:hypothetical protein
MKTKTPTPPKETREHPIFAVAKHLERIKSTEYKGDDPRVIKELALRLREKLEREPRRGTPIEEKVANYLEAYHMGQFQMPDFSDGRYPQNEILAVFHWCLVNNVPDGLKGIAIAIPRVHKRAEGERKSFSLMDANPGLVKLVAECIKLGSSSNAEGESAPTTKDQTISSGLSETVVKDVRRAFGVPPGRRGPKPKSHLSAPKPPVSNVSLKILVNEGTEHFWSKRKKKSKV